MSWWSRLLNRKRLEKQLDAELQYHLERQIASHRARGLTETEARRAAVLQFGGPEQIKEDCRDARGTRWLETTLQDLRFAWRTLRKAPGFTIATVCTLALGIGANTAIFSIIDGVILSPLPYHDPGRLVSVQEQLRASRDNFAFSYPDFLDCKRLGHSFQSIAATHNLGVNVTSPGTPEYVPAREVSAGFLSVLGVNPMLGREFRPEEDRRGAPPVAIIGYSLWKERFAGRANAIGASLVVNGKTYTVIGILPARFRFEGDRQILIPLGQNLTVNSQQRDLYSGIYAVARLKPRVTLGQANRELKALGQRLAHEYPATNSKMTFAAELLKQHVIGDVRPTLLLLAGAVALVFLIACANVANLVLARSLSRTHEFAIRAALGAGRGRLTRQLLTESVLLSIVGGALGFGIAALAVVQWLKHMPDWLPRTDNISLNGHVLLFTLLAAFVAGIVFGLAPALRQGAKAEGELRHGTRATSRGVHRLQSGFVIAELALSVILLTGAGLMMRTVARLWNVNPGFDPHHMLVMEVGLSPKVLSTPALMRTAWNQILEHVRNTPGVKAAALDSLLPLSGGNAQTIEYWTGAGNKPPADAPLAWTYTPTPDYLNTMKIPLLRGRFFTVHDRLGSQPVIVIDENLAKRIFPGKDPVGSELSLQFLGRVRIVGVVGNIKHRSLGEDAYGPPEPAIYVPFLQFPDEFMSLTQNGMNLLVRTSINPISVIKAVKQSVLGPTRDQPVRNVRTMEQAIGDTMAKQRGMLFLLSIFAGVALLLASGGIYGVISYSMTRRIQEIGIRMALGATPSQVLRGILRQGIRMVLTGIAVGVAASLALTHLMTKLLYGIKPTDPVTFTAVVLTLFLIAFAAIVIPARRAAHINPVLALRYE